MNEWTLFTHCQTTVAYFMKCFHLTFPSGCNYMNVKNFTNPNPNRNPNPNSKLKSLSSVFALK